MDTVNEEHSSKIQELTENYKIVLENYFSEQNETNLYKAYSIAHKAISSNINLLELLNSYQKAIADILSKNPEKNEIQSFLSECLKFLSETLAPFEMKIRGYQDAISQLKSKTSFLEQERAKINYIVNRLESGLIVLDAQGSVLLINSALKYYFLKYFNTEVSDGNHISRLTPNILSQTITSCLRKFDNNTFEIELSNDFFLKVVCNTIFIPENDFKKPIFLIIEFHDISTFIQFDRLRTSFISMVSHELRSPLSAISLSIKNMIKYSQDLTSENRQRLEKIISMNSDLMLEIIEDLLLVSQIDENKMTLSYIEFPIKNSINTVLLQLEEKLVEKNIQVRQISEEEVNVSADRTRIEQVIRIIIDNAIKYSYENGNIIIQTQTTTEDNMNYISVSIQDFGRGMKESDLKNLFQRFFRSKDVQDIHGTGLGLAIAKEIISIHKGKIEVNSQYGKGSTFEIRFPMNKIT